MRAALAALALLALGGQAPAVQAQTASFDCGRSTGPIERAICVNSKLTWRDGTLGRLYEGLMNAVPSDERNRLRIAQRRWTVARNTDCSRGDNECLEHAYNERLMELSQRLKDLYAARGAAPPVGGVYDFQQQGQKGTMVLVEQVDGTIEGAFLTIEQAKFRNCQLYITARRQEGGVLAWSGEQADCSGTIRLEGNTARVEAGACSAACGANATLTGPYARR
ncbi:lysozyme inhibitor LprI family protein [Zavarzinia sp. CC-PAN008]|uniref:lysozyme inhibitor LprI family protein n=1 Tax=Zavarzinia sp. CC-PAN008 TaxID=3243332 RepID=UPI003F74729A